VLLRVVHRADLFVLYELGVPPLPADDATFLFELINKRCHSRKAAIITSNKGFGQWGRFSPTRCRRPPCWTGCFIVPHPSTSVVNLTG